MISDDFQQREHNFFTVGAGGTWQLGSKDIQGLGSHGNVVFEVYSTASAIGYLAIDDISIDSSSECPVHGKSVSLSPLKLF